MGLPILPPEKMAKYAAALGDKSLVTTNRKVVLRLPQDYADMLGWEEQVIAVAEAWQGLPPDKRAKAVFIARNYGQAGALEFFGPRHGLTRPILLPKNFLLWPPPAAPCDVVITVGIPQEDLARFFKSTRLIQRFDNAWRVPEEQKVPICIGENPIRDLQEAWPKQK